MVRGRPWGCQGSVAQGRGLAEPPPASPHGCVDTPLHRCKHDRGRALLRKAQRRLHTTMAQPSISTVRRSHLAFVSLDGLGNGAPLSANAAAELAEAFAYLDGDVTVRAIVLRGIGTLPPGGAPAAHAIASLTTPTIGAIAGDCLDQGLELALACDLRIGSTAARFGLRHVAQGLLPSDGGTQRLTRVVGQAHALRLLLTGEIIDVQEAHRMGLVQAVSAPEQLAQAVDDLAGAISSGAPIAAAYAKEAVAAASDLTLAQGLAMEHDLSVLLHTTKDRVEGLRAFAEKRAPEHRGR